VVFNPLVCEYIGIRIPRISKGKVIMSGISWDFLSMHAANPSKNIKINNKVKG
jgi:hypothetical protein